MTYIKKTSEACLSSLHKLPKQRPGVTWQGVSHQSLQSICVVIAHVVTTQCFERERIQALLILHVFTFLIHLPIAGFAVNPSVIYFLDIQHARITRRPHRSSGYNHKRTEISSHRHSSRERRSDHRDQCDCWWCVRRACWSCCGRACWRIIGRLEGKIHRNTTRSILDGY